MPSTTTLLRLTAVVCLGLTSPVAAQVVNPGTGHTYFSTEMVLPFAMARAQADAVGGHVLSLGDAAEEQWVDATFPGGKWIGLTDEVEEGIWLWESGEPFVYQNWSNPVAPYDYVRSVSFAGGWYAVLDQNQSTFQSFAVIETEFPLGPSIESLTVDADEVSADFTWTNPVAFTSIDVYRGYELIAVLPGDATSFSTESVVENRYWFHPQGGALPTRPVSKLAAPTGYRMWVEESELAATSPGAVRMMFANEDRVAGYSYGVCHDPSELELLSVDEGSISQDIGGGGPGLDFHSVDIQPDGFSVGAVLFGAGYTFITIGTEHEMDVAHYQPLVPAGNTAMIDFCVIGSPLTEIVVVPYLGGSITPITEAGTISIIDGFQRGDGNGDGAIDIADPIHNLEHLFYGGPSYCLDAQDTNDDGAVNVADPVYGLSYQFAGGPPPPAPIGLCGVDPTPDLLECDQAPACP